MTHETRTVQSGYSRHATQYTIRPMTFDEICSASGHIHVLTRNQTLVQVKINGQVKRWKTRPMDCSVPYKYGLYEYGRIEFTDGEWTGGPEPAVVVDTIVP